MVAWVFDYDGLPKYITALENWFYPEHRRAYDMRVLPDGKWRLCLAALVFGDDYVDRFLKHCIPSLLAPGNIEALFEPLIIIHTDAASAERVSAGMERLRPFARVEIHVLPDDVVSQVPDNDANKYWLLGGACNLHMQQAKYRACGYHMLMPDFVYCEGYFANLARLAKEGRRVIVQGALSTRMEEIGPALERENHSVSARRLVALGIKYLHARSRRFLMNGRSGNGYPMSLLMLFVGWSQIEIVSPHMTLIYFSHDVLMRVPLRLFSTTDAQLPFLVPEDVEPYVPKANDGMVYVELSDKTQLAPWAGNCTLDEFCARFWIMMYCCRGFERFFAMTTELPLPNEELPVICPMRSRRIERIKRRVREAVNISFEPIYNALPDYLRRDPLIRAAQDGMCYVGQTNVGQTDDEDVEQQAAA